MTLAVWAWITPTVICSACGEKIEVGHDLLQALWGFLVRKHSSSGSALIQPSVTRYIISITEGVVKESHFRTSHTGYMTRLDNYVRSATGRGGDPCVRNWVLYFRNY
jgi:hypothetical protein